jgi:hypothetical protein
LNYFKKNSFGISKSEVAKDLALFRLAEFIVFSTVMSGTFVRAGQNGPGQTGQDGQAVVFVSPVDCF